VTPFQARFLSSEVRTAIDKAVASAPVVLFMKGTPETPQCGFSRASIQILGMQGVDPEKFTAFNVLEDQDLRAGMSKFLYKTRIEGPSQRTVETRMVDALQTSQADVYARY
jgi:monothiol glutaredoxin